jgi:phosphatidylcholine synthase
MAEPPLEHSEPSALERARAFGVHIFTASGAGLALLALLAASRGRWSEMFFWLGVALLVDGVDGMFARRYEVARVLPRWSGDTLDFVVDILTYVFVPAYAIVIGGLLPPSFELIAGFTILITGTLYFADRGMKSTDHYFLGFPAVWNLVAFYLFLLRPEPWIAAAAVVVLAVLTFVPAPFIHPFRVRRYRMINMLALGAWGVLAIVALVRDFAPGPWISGTLSAIALYFLCAGLLRHHRDAKNT